MIRRFLIITHVEHSFAEGQYLGYAPYIREMDLWSKYVEELQILAPLKREKRSTDEAYSHEKILFFRVPAFHLLSISGILRSTFIIPVIVLKCFKIMRGADHLHLRCPGNMGLVACILQIFFPGKSKSSKYAGNWDPEATQPWTYKLQRWILSNTFLTRNMTVLVYGEWPGQSVNIRSFFTASFSEKVISEVQEKTFSEPYIFLFVGNLVAGKGLEIALKVIRRLQKEGLECKMEIYGDGPERMPMEAYVEEARIKGIEFKGNRSLEELEAAYQKAHFVILPSKSEGWPKAVAEGMFFGCIPIVTPVSCVPWMLGKESGEWKEERGILLVDRGQRTEDGNLVVRGQRTEDRISVERGEREEERVLEENVERILEVLKDRERMQRMSRAAKEWSQQYTLERFEAGIREILS